MSGHNKWSQIKHKKGITDQKRSKIFSKLSKMISLAARNGDDPSMNSELRTAIDKAKEANMPSDNIERAVKKGAGTLEGGNILESVRYEAYGPGGVGIIIEGITDNTNRTVAEIKHLLSKHGTSLSETGAVTWAFDPPAGGQEGWKAKHTVKLNEKDEESLNKLLDALDDHDDVTALFTNRSK